LRRRFRSRRGQVSRRARVDARGRGEIRYELRAEVPAALHALPTVGYAMYVPEISSNDAEIGVPVLDTK
jgi:hypothetical protein